MRPVENYNEVMFHRLEAVHHHLELTRGAKSSQANGNGATVHGENTVQTDMNAYSGSTKQNTFDQYKDLDPLHQKIMQIVISEADKNIDGVHVALVARMVKGVDQAKVKDAVEDLTSEGYLYTAADEDHVLPTA